MLVYSFTSETIQYGPIFSICYKCLFLYHFNTQSCGMSLWILDEFVDFTPKEQNDTIKYDIPIKGSLPGRQTLHDKPLGHSVGLLRVLVRRVPHYLSSMKLLCLPVGKDNLLSSEKSLTAKIHGHTYMPLTKVLCLSFHTGPGGWSDSGPQAYEVSA